MPTQKSLISFFRKPKGKAPRMPRNVRRRRGRRGRKLRIPKGPFPRVMNTSLVYKCPSTTITSTGVNSYNYCQFALNSMYDFDQTNIAGNKQPLFYDQLLGVDGPYKWYKVNAWKTTIRFINLSDKAMFVYYSPCDSTLLEADTANEMQNRRGVQSFTVTAQANAKPMVTIKKYQTLRNFFPSSINQSENFSAAYTSGPSTVAYSTLGWQTVDGSTTAYSVAIQVQHIFYCTLYNADSTQS